MIFFPLEQNQLREKNGLYAFIKKKKFKDAHWSAVELYDFN
jgi:hypothetical protein